MMYTGLFRPRFLSQSHQQGAQPKHVDFGGLVTHCVAGCPSFDPFYVYTSTWYYLIYVLFSFLCVLFFYDFAHSVHGFSRSLHDLVQPLLLVIQVTF